MEQYIEYYKLGFISFEKLVEMCKDCKVFLRANETIKEYLMWELYTTGINTEKQ